MKLRSSVVALYHNLFNPWYACVSAIVNGPIVVYYNWHFSTKVALYAGGYQALLSFVSTGVTARVIQHFSPIPDPVRSYVCGTTAAAFLTFLGAATVHWINDTPAFWYSCLTPTLISWSTAFASNALTRYGFFLPANYPGKRN
ncbi:MAG: hypothetical protein JO019_00170 [Candidatus Kaiserbacteria bacterium]|nr:hypothetical protein [Candidatus Kaiserbacteria bacterium]